MGPLTFLLFMATPYRFVLDQARPLMHVDVMANHRAKVREYMRKLASFGGKASGEARYRKKVAKMLDFAKSGRTAQANCSGGSHWNDWRCQECRHFNS